MLVLTRLLNQKIDIGDDVTITVVGIRGDKVKLGIEAPKEMPVHRREITELLADKRFAEETAAMADKNEWPAKDNGVEYDPVQQPLPTRSDFFKGKDGDE